MTDKNLQDFTDYENKILEGLTEIKEGQEMIIEGNKKIQDGKQKMSYGIGDLVNKIEELESKKEELEEVSSSESKKKIIKDIDTVEQSLTDDSHKEGGKVFVKKLVKKQKKRKAEEIARDFDIFGGEYIPDDEEYVYEEVEVEENPKGERIRTGEYEGIGGLLNRKDRNRIIIIFFIFGMFVATVRAIFEGWPIIVWPPYNSFLLHENSWFRCFVRWFVDILVCEIILDFDITPLNDVDRAGGNCNLYIPRAYRGKNAYMRVPGDYNDITGYPPDYY